MSKFVESQGKVVVIIRYIVMPLHPLPKERHPLEKSVYQVPGMPTPQRMRSGCTTIRFPGDISGGTFVCFEKGSALSSSGSVSVTESQPESMGHRT